jgi:hypothetical protein
MRQRIRKPAYTQTSAPLQCPALVARPKVVSRRSGPGYGVTRWFRHTGKAAVTALLDKFHVTGEDSHRHAPAQHGDVDVKKKLLASFGNDPRHVFKDTFFYPDSFP